MSKLYFITSNKKKFEETKAILGDVEQCEIDLPEIQGTDTKKIIKAKLLEALNHKKGEFIVEDTALHIDCLKGFPGPLIKWFLKSLGIYGLYNIVEKMCDDKAQAKTLIGYAKSAKEIYYFEGEIEGRIVSPRGNFGFGWDSIFEPDKHSKTFAEMTGPEKNALSMRRIALNKLAEFLIKDNS
jgi:inosine triphosphate pyrophosphatase